MFGYVVSAALLATASAGVAQPEDADGRAPDHYAAGELARAEFALAERSREGGRTTPFFTSYRPQIVVEGAGPVTCRFVTDADGGHQPGTSGEIGMTCPVALAEGQRFNAFERGRPIGSGVFLPRSPAD